MNQQEKITDLIEELKFRAIKAFEDNNKFAAAYLSYLAGGYSHTFKRGRTNIFEKNSNLLYSWFSFGFEDSQIAVRMSDELREKFAKHDEEQTKKEKKKSFFGIKY